MHLWGPQEREDERDAPEAVEEKLSERSHDLPQPQDVKPRVQPLRCFISCVEQPAIDLMVLKWCSWECSMLCLQGVWGGR